MWCPWQEAVFSPISSWLGYDTEVKTKPKKREKGHNSAHSHQIKKIRSLYFLQFLKLKEIKCHYFFHQTSYAWDISILLFCDKLLDNGKKGIYLEFPKSLYLSNMMSEKKNKDTLYSSTFKVGEIKVRLFSWSEFILVSYGHLIIPWRYRKNPHKSQNDKKHLPPSNDVWSKK